MSLPDLYVATDTAIMQFKMGLWRIWRKLDEKKGVFDLKLGPDKMMYAAHKDGVVRQYSLCNTGANLPIVKEYKGHDAIVRCLALSLDGKRLFCVSW